MLVSEGFWPVMFRCFVVPSVTLKPEGLNSAVSAERRAGRSLSRSKIVPARWSTYSLPGPKVVTVQSSGEQPMPDTSSSRRAVMTRLQRILAMRRSHVGVSELVIRRNAVIQIVSEKTPADFCADRKHTQ